MVPWSLGGLHGLLGDVRSRRREGREDPARMEPAGPLLSKDRLPVDVPGLQLADGRVPPVRAAKGGAEAEAPLGEVEAIAHRAADAVVLGPANDLLHAPLVQQILHEAPHGVVHEGGDHGRVEAETPLESSRHVVLPAPLPDLEGAGRVDPAFAGIEAQHHLAQAHAVPPAVRFRLDLQLTHSCAPPPLATDVSDPKLPSQRTRGPRETNLTWPLFAVAGD